MHQTSDPCSTSGAWDGSLGCREGSPRWLPGLRGSCWYLRGSSFTSGLFWRASDASDDLRGSKGNTTGDTGLMVSLADCRCGARQRSEASTFSRTQVAYKFQKRKQIEFDQEKPHNHHCVALRKMRRGWFQMCAHDPPSPVFFFHAPTGERTKEGRHRSPIFAP